MKEAIVLCSGGIDSVTTAYYVKKKLKYKSLTLLFFNYRQKSLVLERKCAKQCARTLRATFREIALPELARLSTSLINLGENGDVRKQDLRNTQKESEQFYVPFRNTIFLSYALAYAESLYLKEKKQSDIFIGFKCEGKEPYPDTTSRYVKTMNNLAQAAAPMLRTNIIAPLIKRDKEDIIIVAKLLDISLKETWSCYTPLRGKHCGSCLACRLRKAGFYWANMEDVTEYGKIR